MFKTIKRLIPAPVKSGIKKFFPNIKINKKIRQGRKIGINFAPPNYIFKGEWDKSSTIVDVGCGFDADFSVYMINKYGLHSIGVDPTQRHKNDLEAVAKKTNGLFSHQQIAISATDGNLIFNESEDNISGSIFSDHTNVKQDKIKKYEVRSVSLKNLPALLGLQMIKFIKLDLEGAEYDLIQNLKKDDVEKYEQIFVEFHHHCVSRYSQKDTFLCVEKMKELGFAVFTLDNHNFLFYVSKLENKIIRNKPRVLFEQYVIPHYRVPFFRELAKKVDLLVVASTNNIVDGLNDVKENLPFKSIRLHEDPSATLFHRGLLEIIEKFNPDVYISSSYALDKEISNKEVYSKLRKNGLKILWMGCDGYWIRYFYLHLVLSILYPLSSMRNLRQIFAMSKIDGFITYSSYTVKFLIKSRFVARKKIHIAHNAIETEILNDTYKKWKSSGGVKEAYRLVFTGRLTKGKRVDVLLIAFSKILKKYKNAKLDIIGEGSMLDQLKKLSIKLNIENNVIFHGPAYSDEVLAQKMCSASLFVMPGLGGLGFNTAMAVGLPIIYTNADGSENDIITDGYNGWYFNGTIRDLVKKIDTALSDPQKLVIMGDRSEERIVKEFNLKNMVKAYSETIEEVLIEKN